MTEIKKMCNYVNGPQVMTSFQTDDPEYVRLVSQISNLWADAKAKYRDKLLIHLSRDLARLKGKGFSRSNLVYVRKLYLAFPKSETLSHQLTWSHYFELLKCDDPLKMQSYLKECIKERWTVRELKRQFNTSLFQRLALSTNKGKSTCTCQCG